MSQAATNKYFENQMMSASPVRMVVMVYDQAILSLSRVITAVEAGDIEGRWKANQNASECIWELMTAVDQEQGGDVASYLDRLYRFMIRRLLEVDIRNDASPARDVINLLEPLRESWRELERQMESEQAGNAAAAAPESRETSQVAVSA